MLGSTIGSSKSFPLKLNWAWRSAMASHPSHSGASAGRRCHRSFIVEGVEWLESCGTFTPTERPWVIDLKARKRAAPILEPIARGLGKIGASPTMVTVVGLALTIVGASMIADGLLWQGALVAAFGVLLDALDGPLARYKGTASDRGAFIDTMSDRFGEIAVWIGLGVYLRDDQVALILCLVALAFSLLS